MLVKLHAFFAILTSQHPPSQKNIQDIIMESTRSNEQLNQAVKAANNSNMRILDGGDQGSSTEQKARKVNLSEPKETTKKA